MSKFTYKSKLKALEKIREVAVITDLGFGDIYDRLVANLEYVKYGYKSEVRCPKTSNKYIIHNIRNNTVFRISVTTDLGQELAVTEDFTRFIKTSKKDKPKVQVIHNRYIHVGNTILGYVHTDSSGNLTVQMDDRAVDAIEANGLSYDPMEWSFEDIQIMKKI